MSVSLRTQCINIRFCFNSCKYDIATCSQNNSWLNTCKLTQIRITIHTLYTWTSDGKFTKRTRIDQFLQYFHSTRAIPASNI